jgi:hypothetical protein
VERRGAKLRGKQEVEGVVGVVGVTVLEREWLECCSCENGVVAAVDNP